MRIIEPSVELLDITDNAEKKIEIAGRTCYKSENKITEESSAEFIRMLLKRGHESVLEHCTASFRLVTNRYTTHQIVRHRLFSYSQESQRYCNYSKDKFENSIQFVRPLDIDRDTEVYYQWESAMKEAEEKYFQMIEMGCAPQVARSVLPSSTKTEIVMTGNFRSWNHFLDLRLSQKAQSDVRYLASMIFTELYNHAPNCFYREN
jgi:thymidylate synthase (FAD)